MYVHGNQLTQTDGRRTTDDGRRTTDDGPQTTLKSLLLPETVILSSRKKKIRPSYQYTFPPFFLPIQCLPGVAVNLLSIWGWSTDVKRTYYLRRRSVAFASYQERTFGDPDNTYTKTQFYRSQLPQTK